MTDARDVECNDLPLRHPAGNGFEQLYVAADSVKEKQRYSRSLSGLVTHAQCMTVKRQHLRLETALAVPRMRTHALIVVRIHSPRPCIVESAGVSPIAAAAWTYKRGLRITAGCAVHAAGSCPRWISVGRR